MENCTLLSWSAENVYLSYALQCAIVRDKMPFLVRHYLSAPCTWL